MRATGGSVGSPIVEPGPGVGMSLRDQGSVPQSFLNSCGGRKSELKAPQLHGVLCTPPSVKQGRLMLDEFESTAIGELQLVKLQVFDSLLHCWLKPSTVVFRLYPAGLPLKRRSVGDQTSGVVGSALFRMYFGAGMFRVTERC